jgi:uncharacterized protein (TIGR02646 family)
MLVDLKKGVKQKHNRKAHYNDLHSQEKNKLKGILMDEQHFLCCYCMKSIDLGTSHIEHIKPQSLFPKEDLEYDNLLASCNGYNEEHENCAHNKANWWDPNEFVTPVQSDCETVFKYSIDGRMYSQSIGGETTIDRLNLNSYLLISARKAAIYYSGLFDEDFTVRQNEMQQFYSTPDNKNKLPQFCMAVIYCITNCII